MKEGESATLRFPPDGNENNTFFRTERLMIKLSFPSVKGEAGSKSKLSTSTRMEMYGDTCNILNEVRGWFKDPSLEDMGRKYWKKRSYVFQGFVTENPIAEDPNLKSQLDVLLLVPNFPKLLSRRLWIPIWKNYPTDYTAGVDFLPTKHPKVGTLTTPTSTGHVEIFPLGDAEMNVPNTHGLSHLVTQEAQMKWVLR